MKKVIHRKIKKIETKKGNTIEWCKGLPGKQVSVYYRKKGIEFAKHFHKGDDSSKNPERFLLLKGRIKFNCRLDGEKTEFIANQGDEVLIYPMVIHTAKALEDSIFIEYRSTPFDINNSDTYPID